MSDGGLKNGKRPWAIRLDQTVVRKGWKVQFRRLYRAMMYRRFWKVWFERIKRVAPVIVKGFAFVVAFCIWPIGLLVLLYELMVCLFPSTADLLSPQLADLFPSLKDLFNRKTEPDEDLFSRVRVNMVILTAWVGVFFLVWRTRIADKQTQINQESHYTELFTKAVEQLGAVRENGEPAIEMRIGAIFALERLAKDSERDYGPIIETLAAYIREHCRDPKFFDDKGLVGKELRQEREKWIESLRENPPADRSDVSAALTVLSRREKNRNWKSSTSDPETQPDFTGANFQGSTLWNKSEGLARKDTNLRLADLSGASLERANLSGAYLAEAKFEGAYLFGADLSGASLERANLSDIYLWRANLSGAYLAEANLSGANLRGIVFDGAILSAVNLSDADLERVDLSGNSLWRADLSGADLWCADLEGATFAGASLAEANLKGADLEKANLSDADIRGANLEGALLVGAQLKDSKGLTDEMIQKAFGDVDTSLPDGITRPEHWGSGKDAIEQWQAFWK